MAFYQCLQLIKLDLILLLKIGIAALRHAGFLHSAPLLVTMVLFMVITIISNTSRLFIDVTHNSLVLPWMVKYQFIFAYSENTKRSIGEEDRYEISFG